MINASITPYFGVHLVVSPPIQKRFDAAVEGYKAATVGFHYLIAESNLEEVNALKTFVSDRIDGVTATLGYKKPWVNFDSMLYEGFYLQFKDAFGNSLKILGSLPDLNYYLTKTKENLSEKGVMESLKGDVLGLGDENKYFHIYSKAYKGAKKHCRSFEKHFVSGKSWF